VGAVVGIPPSAGFSEVTTDRLDCPQALFVLERGYRVQSSGSPGRQIACPQCDRRPGIMSSCATSPGPAIAQRTFFPEYNPSTSLIPRLPLNASVELPTQELGCRMSRKRTARVHRESDRLDQTEKLFDRIPPLQS
jgi:hypothetical protein